MTEELPQRIAAIVGRPNVGKSALFNRMVGRRLSIVHEQSGVTRDRVVSEAAWNEQRFQLIDTGGLGHIDRAATGDIIESGINAQIDAAIEDAPVLIFVVNIEDGIVPLDEEVARLLHASGRRVVLAANKADHAGRDEDAAAFASLGFPVFPVSALHNRGIGELAEAVEAALPEAPDESDVDALKVAVVGRPNVGKSSYINRLLRSDRVIVSDVPGTTRDSIEIPFVVGRGPQARHYRLIDTAGMRRKGKARDAVEKFSIIRAEKSIERADVAVLVVDAERGPSAQDKKIAALIQEKQRGCVLLVNKWDLSDVTQRKFEPLFRGAFPFLQYVPIVFVSSLTGYNVRKSIDTIDYVAEQVRTTLSTGVLNRVLRDAFEEVQPPMVSGKRLKLFYATQFGISPVRIKLFVNSRRCVKPAYESYLVRTLRQAFGLEGAPIQLLFSARKTSAARR